MTNDFKSYEEAQNELEKIQCTISVHPDPRERVTHTRNHRRYPLNSEELEYLIKSIGFRPKHRIQPTATTNIRKSLIRERTPYRLRQQTTSPHEPRRGPGKKKDIDQGVRGATIQAPPISFSPGGGPPPPDPSRPSPDPGAASPSPSTAPQPAASSPPPPAAQRPP